MSALIIPASGGAAGGFDYSQLDQATADIAQRAVAGIRERTRANIIETGRDLARIKDILPHGAYGKWLTAEFNMTERTARNYIGAAALVDQLPPAKAEIVSALPPATIYTLASPALNDETREALVGRVIDGDADFRSIRDTISKARTDAAAKVAAQRKAAQKAKLSPEQAKSHEQRERSKERKAEAERTRFERERRDRMDAAEGVASSVAALCTPDICAALLMQIELSDPYSLRDALVRALKGVQA